MKNGERWSSDRVFEKRKNNLFNINYAHVDKVSKLLNKIKKIC